MLEMVPEFHLDEMTARLFGAERLASYGQGFDHADAALIDRLVDGAAVGLRAALAIPATSERSNDRDYG